ncbi:MAG: aminomethyltransferase beta-barrel domain-containing protein [Opitutaceae bacterium]
MVFDTPQRGLASGQVLALYNGERRRGEGDSKERNGEGGILHGVDRGAGRRRGVGEKANVTVPA